MSYDVSIGKKSFNYTSNVSKLWYDHIPNGGRGGGLNELHGLTGRAAVSVLREAFDRLNAVRPAKGQDLDFFSKYDSPNGWGSSHGAIIFMANIMAACAENPRSKVFVSC